jgi:galactokinase
MDSTGTSGDFERHYGRTPQRAIAPGRVNLIGEHTDYNDGFVLPMAIDLSTEVAFAALPGASASLRVRSSAFAGEEVEIPLGVQDSRRGHWSDYIAGVLRTLEACGIQPPPSALWIEGRVPPGSGLSSSAALEVAVALALLRLAGESLPGPRVAALCRQAENEYVGTRCGIMDPFVSRLGRAGHALFLDCRSLDVVHVPLPADLEIAIVHSEVQHALASGAYNLRREQCENAVGILAGRRPEVRSLRDVSIGELEQSRSSMEDAVYRRARHVITENHRVEAFVGALEKGQLADLGGLLAESHRSLREDFEVSCAELDLLVELSGRVTDSLGARMTGGGFGGCTIHLARRGRGRAVAEGVADAYAERMGFRPRWWVTSAAAGARVEADTAV